MLYSVRNVYAKGKSWSCPCGYVSTKRGERVKERKYNWVNFLSYHDHQSGGLLREIVQCLKNLPEKVFPYEDDDNNDVGIFLCIFQAVVEAVMMMTTVIRKKYCMSAMCILLAGFSTYLF